tara:strand:- start:1236 stop:3002 length:1767 start_codon:yes stop_codon:yes gene_type:complete
MLISKILFFIDDKDKKSLVILLFLAIFIGFVELLGVASIVPFVGLLNDPDYIADNKYFILINSYLNIKKESLIFVSGIFMVTTFILINFLNAYNLWKTTNFGAISSHKISLSVTQNYFNKPYKFFVDADIASVSKNILEESLCLSESIFIPLMQIISKVIVLLFISILLISVDVEAFFASLIIFTIIYLILFRTIKQKVKNYGIDRLKANDARFKNINDCLSSIKDVKFYNAEQYYLDNFSKSQENFLSLTVKSIILATMPRYIIEVVAFGGFFSVILYLKFIGADLTMHLPVISLFILAAYRLLPSLNQIYALSSTLRFHIPALDIIYESMNNNKLFSKTINKKKMSEQICFSDVCFSYNESKPILHNINLKIKQGTTNAIIGQTGVGKTTLLDLLLGFYSPTEGSIYINQNLFEEKNNKPRIGYVSQKISFVDDSILKNIAFGIPKNEIDENNIQKVVDTVMLKDLVKELPNKIHEKIGEDGVKLSGGQLQRIGIARALYLKPQVLILDEATNALDVETERLVFDSIKKDYNGISIIWITHRSSSLTLCDNIYLMNNNTIKLYNSHDDPSVILAMKKEIQNEVSKK